MSFQVRVCRSALCEKSKPCVNVAGGAKRSIRLEKCYSAVHHLIVGFVALYISQPKQLVSPHLLQTETARGEEKLSSNGSHQVQNSLLCGKDMFFFQG